MRVSTEHERLVRMLKESISLMCKNALTYDVELNVEGLLGITLDKRDIFLININESFQSAAASLIGDGIAHKRDGEDSAAITKQEGVSRSKRRRLARRSSRESQGQSDNDVEQYDEHTENNQSRVNNSEFSQPRVDVDPGYCTEVAGLEEMVIKQEVDQCSEEDDFEHIDLVDDGDDSGNQPLFPVAMPSGSGAMSSTQMASTYSLSQSHLRKLDPYLALSTAEGFDSPSEQLWKCNECEQTFWSKCDLDEHTSVTHNCGHLCKLCGKIFKSRQIMLVHYRQVHNLLESPLCHCRVCGKEFKVKRFKNIHEKTCGTSSKKWICEECGPDGREYQTKKGLRDHILGVHQHNKQRYKCPHCSESFPYRSSLARHKKAAHIL